MGRAKDRPVKIMRSFEAKQAKARQASMARAAQIQTRDVLSEELTELQRYLETRALPHGVESIGPCNGGRSNDWQARIVGPANTPYEGGVFELRFTFEAPFPMIPPVVTFVTPIYHPQVASSGANVSLPGAIGLELLHSRWLPSTKPWHIAFLVRMMLQRPNEPILLRDGGSSSAERPRTVSMHSLGATRDGTGRVQRLGVSPMQPAHCLWQFANDRRRFDELARLWTQRYATPAVAEHGDSNAHVPALYALAACALGCACPCMHEGCSLAAVPDSMWASVNAAREEYGYSALGVRPPARRAEPVTLKSMSRPAAARRPFAPCAKFGSSESPGHVCEWSSKGQPICACAEAC
jgi:ubiquitin-protein ligase